MSTVEGWKTSSLPLLLHLMKSGGTPDTSRSDYYGGQIPFVSIEDMTASNKHLTSTIKKLTDKGLKNSNAWIVPENSILYSIYATLGLPRINTIPVTSNQAILALINDKNKIYRDYLYYWLEYIRPSVVNFSSQTTQSNLSATIVKSFLVDYPDDLTEQTKIAEILSTVDQAIEQTEVLIAKQQRIKTGLMQDLLTRGIDEHGNLRSEQTHEFKDSPLGRIPVEWVVEDLSTLVDEGITYGIVQAGPHVDDGVPYIRTGDMSGDTIDVKQLLRTSQKIANSFKRSEVHVGDIVFALRATVGKVLPVVCDLDGANLTQGTAKISPKQLIESSFLLWTLRSSYIQDQIRLHQKGTTFMEITLSDLRTLKIARPMNRNEQSKISDLLSNQDRLRSEYTKNLQKLHHIKTALMQDLLTGKKRVTALLESTH
jgi:type I restriction enzyme S subunit